jgi:hypothetical protein
VSAHRRHAGDDPELLFHSARAKVLLRKPAEAASLLRKACRRQADERQRRWYVAQFARDMAAAGRALEGYRAAPDKPAAFEGLAQDLLSRKKEKELGALLSEHGKTHSKDPFYRFYCGEQALLRGDHAGAERHFRAALAKAAPQQQWMARNGLYRARVKAGKAAEAFKEAGPEAFEALATVCLGEKNAGQLEALLAARRKAKPADRDLPAWELELRWLKKDYEGALKLLAQHREGALAQPRWRWKRDDYLVRCLVRLRRADDAVRAAQGLRKGGEGNPVLLILAHAARGGAEEALAALEKLGRRRAHLGICYRDPDLGPMLRSEPFRAFREKYPEPKDEPDEDES